MREDPSTGGVIHVAPPSVAMRARASLPSSRRRGTCSFTAEPGDERATASAGLPRRILLSNGTNALPAKNARVIRSFKDQDTRRFFEGRRVAAFQGFATQAVRRLVLLDSAETLADLAALPSNRLEALRGNRAGQHSIRVNAQRRICFQWTDEGPCEVEIVDYH